MIEFESSVLYVFASMSGLAIGLTYPRRSSPYWWKLAWLCSIPICLVLSTVWFLVYWRITGIAPDFLITAKSIGLVAIANFLIMLVCSGVGAVSRLAVLLIGTLATLFGIVVATEKDRA